ncbi:MAG: peptidase M15 [Piscirickettsiaceae bacterium]|nr:peptidase M15 [Piscirickettsiaceae bacterium]
MFAPNFTRDELIHSNTAKLAGIDNTPSKLDNDNLQKMSWFLQALKMELSARFGTNVLIRVSSGFRCFDLNTELGGSKDSDHMRGLAADITCSHLTPYQLAKFIEDEMKPLGYKQIIQEHGRWVHIGLMEVESRLESLTASKKAGQLVYSRGIHNV